MLTILDSSARLCDGLTRREWLQVGSLGAFGLTLPRLLSAREAGGQARGDVMCRRRLAHGAPKADSHGAAWCEEASRT